MGGNTSTSPLLEIEMITYSSQNVQIGKLSVFNFDSDYGPPEGGPSV